MVRAPLAAPIEQRSDLKEIWNKLPVTIFLNQRVLSCKIFHPQNTTLKICRERRIESSMCPTGGTEGLLPGCHEGNAPVTPAGGAGGQCRHLLFLLNTPMHVTFTALNSHEGSPGSCTLSACKITHLPTQGSSKSSWNNNPTKSRYWGTLWGHSQSGLWLCNREFSWKATVPFLSSDNIKAWLLHLSNAEP